MAGPTASGAMKAAERGGGRILYRTEFEKGVLISNFEKRGWERAGEGDEWNFFWASKGSTRAMFNPYAGSGAGAGSASAPGAATAPGAGGAAGSGGAAAGADTVSSPLARDMESPVPRVRLKDTQMINHFPNHGELTRKDTLAKNCKRCVGVYVCPRVCVCVCVRMCMCVRVAAVTAAAVVRHT
jgi:hypothetical protein